MKILLVIGALPIAIYPFVALASVMSLAAQPTGRESALILITARAFQISSLLYPVVFLASLLWAMSEKKTNPSKAARIAAIPLWFLLVVCLLFVAWSVLGTS